MLAKWMILAVVCASLAHGRAVTCSVGTGLYPTLRADGMAEMIADIYIRCTGGVPAGAGSPLPQLTIRLTPPAGIGITSRLLAPGWTEALLTVDEPPSDRLYPCELESGVCPGFGNGTGSGYYGNGPQSPSAPNNRNLFQGRLDSGSLVWSVPFDPPGDGISRIFLLRNVRVNASQLGLLPFNTAFLFVTVSAALPGNVVLPARSVSAGEISASVQRAGGSFTVDTRRAGDRVRIPDASVLVSPLYRRAFKPAVVDPTVFHGQLPRTPLDAESGFYSNTLPGLGRRGQLSQAGRADAGTRVMMRFDNVPSGARLYVLAAMQSPQGALGFPAAQFQMTAADINGAGAFAPITGDALGLAEVPDYGSFRMAVWEVVASQRDSYADFIPGVWASYPAGLNWSTPTTVAVRFGPTSNEAGPAGSAPIPRFVGFPALSAPCSYSVTPTLVDLPAEPSEAKFRVQAPPLCQWSLAGAQPAWLSPNQSPEQDGPGAFNFRSAFNPGPPRSADFQLAGTPIRIRQRGSGATLPVPMVVSPLPNQTIEVTGVTLAWNPVSGSDGYDLRILQTDSAVAVFKGSVAGAMATSTLVDLPWGDYDLYVRACSGGFDDNHCGPFGGTAFKVRQSAPMTWPTLIAPVSGRIVDSTTTIRWSAVDGATSYLVEVIDSTFLPVLQIRVPGTETSTVHSWQSGRYQVWLYACTIGCRLAAIVPPTVDVDLPAIPAGAPAITRSDLTVNRLDLAWTQVPGADIYRVQVVQPNTGPGGGALTVSTLRTTVATANLTVPAGSAAVVVAACNGNGCGPNSAPQNINPSGPNPVAPILGSPLAGANIDGPATFFSWARVPGDNGSNTTYRLYVSDMSRSAPAFDIQTTDNFASGFFAAEGRRYDAVVVANPGPGQTVGPPVGFIVQGRSSQSPTLVAPAHRSTVKQGNVQIGWSPIPQTTVYQYFVAVRGESAPAATGITPGLLVQVPLTARNGATTIYSAIVRACRSYPCDTSSPEDWGPWSNEPGGPGVTDFTVVP